MAVGHYHVVQFQEELLGFRAMEDQWAPRISFARAIAFHPRLLTLGHGVLYEGVHDGRLVLPPLLYEGVLDLAHGKEYV